MKTAATSTQAFSEAGQNMVEFGLVIGLVIVFLIGLVDLTNALQQKSDLDKIVRQAARQAGEFGGDEVQVQAYIDKQLELMGYDPTAVTSVKIEAHERNGALIQDKAGTDATCVYGEFVAVEVDMTWSVSVPTTLFFSGFSDLDTLNIKHASICWRS